MLRSLAAPLAFFFLSACSSSGPGPTDGGTTDGGTTTPIIETQALPIPHASIYESEPTIAVSAGGTVLIAWLDIMSGTASLGYSFSRDRGVTWEPSQLLTLPDGRFGSNEIVQADAQGNFYLVTLGVNPDGKSSIVYLAKGSAGATTFGVPVEVSDKSVTAMRDATAFVIAHDGSMNIVWAEYEAAGSHVVAARSADGASFTWANISSGMEASAWPNLCASKATGRVAAVFVDASDNATGVRWSSDDGKTWPAENQNLVPLSEYPGEFPSCVQGALDLWIMQGTASVAPSRTYEPTLDNIELTHSGDGGLTLDATVNAQDPAAGDKYMRAMAFLNDDQSLSLTYYAGSIDSHPAATVRYSHSTDAGKTFSTSIELFGPVLLTTSRAGKTWLGDLLGITADAQHTFFTYVDNSSGAAHINFTRVAR